MIDLENEVADIADAFVQQAENLDFSIEQLLHWINRMGELADDMGRTGFERTLDDDFVELSRDLHDDLYMGILRDAGRDINEAVKWLDRNWS